MLRPISARAVIALAIAFASFANADTPSPNFPEGFTQQTVFKSGTGGYLFYRIPSAVVTKRGTVLIFAEGRRSPWGAGADSGEIHTVLKRSTDGGDTFGPTQVVFADGKNTCGNPTAVVDAKTGRIVVLMCHNDGESDEQSARVGRTVWVSTSDDDGVTWSKPRDITAAVKKPDWNWYATGPGIGVQLTRGPHAGRLVIPCNHSVSKTSGGGGYAHVIYSDDAGDTWHLGGDSPEGFNETQCVEVGDGAVMLNMRNNKIASRPKETPKRRGVTISRDGGATFAETRRDETLVEPICQGSVLRYDWPADGRAGRILFSNPANEAERTDMTLRISTDDGKTWPVANLVHKGWSCYSSMAKLPDGRVALFYEAGDRARYERIDLARVSLDWIAAQPSGAPKATTQPSPH